ncbi:PH domain-containing protein [Formosa sp. 4Alg 33]|uniref:PH domain-containing protein n=1 Tax=Formosa sp. 4Alg 33 TaxID=3382189 RepID=UPI003D9C5D41
MTLYKSEFGYRLVGFLVVLFLSINGFMIFQNEPIEEILSVSGIHLLVLSFFLYLHFSTAYTIHDHGILNVKCGFMYNKSFDINKIKSIRKSNNMISSPAPSMDRIELAYGTFNVIVISPKNKIQFAKELTKINPNIENRLNEKANTTL